MLLTAAAVAALSLTLNSIEASGDKPLASTVRSALSGNGSTKRLDLSALDDTTIDRLADEIESGPAEDENGDWEMMQAASEIVCILRNVPCSEEYAIAE